MPKSDSAPGASRTPLEAAVWSALGAVIDPELRLPLVELDMIESVQETAAGRVQVGIRLTIAGCPAARQIESEVHAAAAGAAGVESAEVLVDVMTPAQRAALTERLRGSRAHRVMPFGPDSLTRVIAVTSGKGGVGKSTLTANLAVALAQQGLAVGVLDADVHGFSQPGLFGLVEDGQTVRPTRVDDLILPPVAYGVKVISIGMFLAGNAPVAWRGPMLHRTVEQFLNDVFFGDLDVLLLDLPPGTGDVAITVGQLLPNAEVLVITTPQPAAAEVAERSGMLAQQTGQRVIGVVENMTGLVAPDGSVLELFGSGGGVQLAERLSAVQESAVPLLASIPLSLPLRVGGDAGTPVVLSDPDDPSALALKQLAERLTGQGRGLAGRPLGVTPR